jgi:hypothetical protein
MSRGLCNRVFYVGRPVHTADAFASCFAAVEPGLLSGRSLQCCSLWCSADIGEADARSRRAGPTRLTVSVRCHSCGKSDFE